jgi:hypothetical protein
MLGCATVIGGATAIVSAQDSTATKQTKRVNEGGRDPFRKYEVPKVPVRKSGQVMPPSIQERIEQYKAQKVAAMNARIAAPKPTTALLLNEIQVVGITRTPRGYAAIVEATPIRLSYVVYPGERFYDGQLVAIEDNRLVFRRETVFADGRRDRVVELKSLRQPSSVDAMTAAKSAGTTTAPTTTPEQKPEPKPAASEKP